MEKEIIEMVEKRAKKLTETYSKILVKIIISKQIYNI